MLRKVLIANRGEIALRVMRTARRLGISTVAVYSDADKDALFVRHADESVAIGPSPASESYLRLDRIIEAARRTGADCIHPGYGFLSENADLPDACAKAGIAFIGPSGEAMRKLGGKAAAKAIARSAGVSVVPGYDGEAQDARTLGAEAGRIGYPVMIKAVAGGGGRGMRLVTKAADFAAALESAAREAKASFGDPRVLVEKVVVAPRHVEVQVFGDSKGNVVHLFERDCSLQRRNQKVIEEAPAPGMSEGLRAHITGAAVKLAKAVGYEGAGTVEFLVEGGTLGPSAPWYFIEMNTRLQVEHPVTEEVTGLDLVEWQFRVAAGEPLPSSQSDIRLRGHAIEARLCTEDPARDFRPSAGRIVHFEPAEAEALRIESGVETGSEVPPFYDSMVAKLIASGPDRETARQRLVDGLRRTVLAGPVTNARFLVALLEDKGVRAARMDTGLIGREIGRLTEAPIARPVVELAALHLVEAARARGLAARGAHSGGWPSPWDAGDGFQLGGERRQSVKIMANGAPATVDVWWRPEGPVVPVAASNHPPGEADTPEAAVIEDGDRVLVIADLVQTEVAWPTYDPSSVEVDGGGTLRAPINGRVARIFVKTGASVAKGDRVAVVEAMKMEHVVVAPRDGTVASIGVAEGDQVVQGTPLVILAEAA